MRLQSLELRTFGHFTNKRLEFSPEAKLHLILGNNEAGKTTLLKAYYRFLFGYPRLTREIDEAFLAAPQDLVVNGDLVFDNGEQLSLSRELRTLREVESGDKLSDGTLPEKIGSIEQDFYRLVFAMDQTALRIGGENLLRDTKGGLFAASSGLEGVSELISSLEKESKEIFTPRGQKQKLNAALSRIKALNDQQKSNTLTVAKWQALEEGLSERKAAVEQLEDQRKTVLSRLAQLARIRSNLALVVRYKQTQAQLGALSDLPAFSEDRIQRIRSSLLSIQQQTFQLDNLKRRKSEKEAEVKGLDVTSAFLELEREFEVFENDYHRILAFRNDLPKRRAEIREARNNVTARIAEVDLQGDAADVLAKLPNDVDVKLLRDLAIRDRQIQDQQAALEDKVVEEETKQALLEEKLSSDPKSLDELKQLDVLFANVGLLHDQTRRLNQTKNDLEQKKGLLEQRLTALGLGSLPLSDVPALEIPERSRVEYFQTRLDKSSAKIAELQTIYAEGAKKLTALEQAEADLLNGRIAVTREDLEQTRSDRDEIVVQIANDGVMLVPALKNQLAHLDRQTDDLLLQSLNQGKLDALAKQREELSQELTATKEEGQSERKILDQVSAEWQGLCQKLGLQDKSPADVLEWLEGFRNLLSRKIEWNEAHSKLEHEFLNLDTDLEPIANVLSIPQSADPGWRDNLCQKANTYKSEIETALQRRTELQSRLDAVDETLTVDRRKVEGVRASREQVSKDWAELRSNQQGLDQFEKLQHAALFVDGVDRLRASIEKLQDIERRVNSMESEVEQFIVQTAHLAGLCSLDPCAPGKEFEQAKELIQLRRLAVRKHDLQQTALRELSIVDQEIAQLVMTSEQEQHGIDVSFDGLTKPEPAEMEGWLDEAGKRNQLLSDVRDLEIQILNNGQGLALDSAIAEATVEDATSLELETEALTLQKDELDAEWKAALEALTRAQDARNEEAKSTRDVDTRQALEFALAEARREVHRYVEVAAAHALLKESLRQFYQKNRTPILQEAQQAFSVLTQNRYLGLEIEEEETDPVYCVTADGRKIPLNGLSEGTADQLYLALRFAKVKDHCKKSEGLPFIGDDLLVNFDDKRSTAAFEAMANLAPNCQMIYLTHHPHMVDLAYEAVGKEHVQVLDLA